MPMKPSPRDWPPPFARLTGRWPPQGSFPVETGAWFYTKAKVLAATLRVDIYIYIYVCIYIHTYTYIHIYVCLIMYLYHKYGAEALKPYPPCSAVPKSEWRGVWTLDPADLAQKLCPCAFGARCFAVRFRAVTPLSAKTFQLPSIFIPSTTKQGL